MRLTRIQCPSSASFLLFTSFCGLLWLQNEPYDQFAANNIISTYDDARYTTKLDAESLPSCVLLSVVVIRA